MSLKNRKIIITAGCSGLGKEFTLFLLEKEAVVIPTTRSKDTVSAFLDTLPSSYKKRCFPEVLNYTEGEMDEFVERVAHGQKEIYGLINCAACRDVVKDTLSVSLDEWRKHFDTNVFGTTYLSVRTANKLIRQDGCIVNMSSFYSESIPDNRVYDENTIPTSLIYAASKAALNYATRYLAVEYAKKNIRVNAVLAGGIRNPSRQSDFFLEQYSYRTPMNRMARTDEFNDAILFFLSPSNTFCTGQLLSIDGGWGLL